jgi:hypothetical protein
MEKMVRYRDVSLSSVLRKYTHRKMSKDPGVVARDIFRCYSAQVDDLRQRGMEKAVVFEASFRQALFFVNSKELVLNRDKIAQAVSENQIEGPFPTNREVVDYCNRQGYSIMDFYSRRNNLGSENLSRFNDEKLNQYIKNRSRKGRLNNLSPFVDKDTAPLNHVPLATVTGRTHTYSPNVQGLNEKYYGQGYVLDFVSYEACIYLDLFNPPAYKLFLDSEAKDFYGWLYCFLNKNVGCGPDELKEKFPEKRSKIKLMFVQMLNGATPAGVAFKLSVKKEQIQGTYNNMSLLLDIEKNRDSLAKDVSKRGFFKIGDFHNRKVYDKRSILLNEAFLSFRSRGTAGDEDAMERFYFSEYKEALLNCGKLAINRSVSGSAAVNFKQSVVDIYDAGYIDSLRVLKYDSMFFQGMSEKDAEKVKVIMEESYFKVFNSRLCKVKLKLN